MTHKLFGEYLRLTRDLSRMTQEEFSRYLGCHQSTISLIESGKRVQGGKIHRIARKLDVPLEDFIHSQADDWTQWNYIHDNKFYLSNLVENGDYRSMDYYLKEWASPNFHGKKDLLFYRLCSGIYEFRQNQNIDSATHHVEDAIRLATTCECLSGQTELLNRYGLTLVNFKNSKNLQHLLTKAEEVLPVLLHRFHPTINIKPLSK